MIDLTNKRVLVTGGTGLVGRELVYLLSKMNCKSITSASLDESNIDPDIALHCQCDLRNFDICMNLCKDKDIIFHVAGIKGSPVVASSKQYTFFTNFIQLNTSMIAAMFASKMEWGVYTSTLGVYGPAPVFKEEELWDRMPSPHDWFAGWAKRMGEVQIDAFEAQYMRRPMSIIRPVNIYGKYDNFDPSTSTLVPSLIRKAAEATDIIEVWGDGSAERDIIHAKDCARALLHVVINQITQPLNVGTGYGTSVKELIETLINIIPKDLTIKYDLTKPTGDKLRITDTSKLDASGFKPIISLREGLEDTYNWYIEEGRKIYTRYNPFTNKDHVNL